MKGEGVGWERGKGRVVLGNWTWLIITTSPWTMQFSVQQLGVGNPFLKILRVLIPQSDNLAKMLPWDKFQDKMQWFVRCKISDWEALCSRVEIVALINVGVSCCWLSQGFGERGRIWSHEEIPPSCLLIYSVININTVEIRKVFFPVVTHLCMNSLQRPDAGQ